MHDIVKNVKIVRSICSINPMEDIVVLDCSGIMHGDSVSHDFNNWWKNGEKAPIFIVTSKAEEETRKHMPEKIKNIMSKDTTISIDIPNLSFKFPYLSESLENIKSLGILTSKSILSDQIRENSSFFFNRIHEAVANAHIVKPCRLWNVSYSKACADTTTEEILNFYNIYEKSCDLSFLDSNARVKNQKRSIENLIAIGDCLKSSYHRMHRLKFSRANTLLQKVRIDSQMLASKKEIYSEEGKSVYETIEMNHNYNIKTLMKLCLKGGIYEKINGQKYPSIINKAIDATSYYLNLPSKTDMEIALAVNYPYEQILKDIPEERKERLKRVEIWTRDCHISNLVSLQRCLNIRY